MAGPPTPDEFFKKVLPNHSGKDATGAGVPLPRRGHSWRFYQPEDFWEYSMSDPDVHVDRKLMWDDYKEARKIFRRWDPT